MIRSLGELSGLEFVARIGIERDKDKPEDSGRNVIKAAIGADHAEYASLGKEFLRGVRFERLPR